MSNAFVILIVLSLAIGYGLKNMLVALQLIAVVVAIRILWKFLTK